MVDGQQKGPGAHAARRIAHTPSERLDSPAARLATRRVKLLQSLCELASGRLDVSGESLGHYETRPMRLHDDFVLCLSYFAMSNRLSVYFGLNGWQLHVPPSQR
jgi:hypothetical protein